MSGRWRGEGVGRGAGRDRDRHAGVHQLGGGRRRSPPSPRRRCTDFAANPGSADGRLGHRQRAAVDLLEQTVAVQRVQVTPHRHVGDAEQLDEVGDPHGRRRRLELGEDPALGAVRRASGPPPARRPRRPRAPAGRRSTSAAGDQLDARCTSTGAAASPWLMTKSQLASSPTRRRVTSTRSAAPGSVSMPVSATSRSTSRSVPPGSRRVATYHAVPSPTVLRVTAGSPAAGPSTYVATASAPASSRSSVQVSAVTASVAQLHLHRPAGQQREELGRCGRPAARGTRPGSRRDGCGRARRRCR